MGVADVELLSGWQNSGSDGVERESAQDEYDRQTAEKAAAVKERQVRLGHVPPPEPEPEEKPKRRSRSKKK